MARPLREKRMGSVYMGPDEFTAFLEKTNEEYKSILAEIGFLKQQ